MKLEDKLVLVTGASGGIAGAGRWQPGAEPGGRTFIVTHDVADFDAVASQVAARELYAGSQIVSSPSVGRDVHPYLALHRDRFDGQPADQIDLADVQRVVVVDVRRESRLAHVAALGARRRADPRAFELVIYDHHPASPDDLRGDREFIEPVGSATTLIVEQMRAKSIAVDRVTATLLALGLHADTGSLTFTRTSARDARALAFLLESGAELAVLTRYLHAPLDLARRHVLANVLESTQLASVRGLSVGLAVLEVDKKLSGLDEVTTRAHETLGCTALFALYTTATGKLQIIGRSRSQAIDVGAALAALGGGGHASAGAASVRGSSPEEVKNRLIESLQSQPSVGLTARDLMHSPVFTVSPETEMREIDRGLEQQAYSGACVLRDGRLVAVIARSDIERARSSGQLQLEVKSFMSGQVITTAPDVPLEQLLESMEQHDVGRLPVLDGGRLIGIVTRKDVRRALYGES